MSSLLRCPLCCSQEFSSRFLLKSHILNILDRLICPSCNSKFHSILDLAEHLSKECKIPKNTFKQSIKHEVVEVRENTEFEQIPNDELPLETEEAESTYFCQMCNFHINSVEEHLEKYHRDEEVIVETDEPLDHLKGDRLEEGEEEIISLLEDGTDNTEYAENEDNLHVLEEDVDNPEYVDKDLNETVEQPNHYYDENGTHSGPITETYFLTKDGESKKITEEEADQLKDKRNVISVHLCPKCGLQFPQYDHFVKHLCTARKIIEKFKCVHCAAVFENYQTFIIHMKSHLVKDADGKTKRVITLGPHTCNVCNTMFPSFKSLRLHKRMHEPVKEKAPDSPVNYTITGPKNTIEIVRKMFICTVCNNTIDKQYQEIHMKSHNEEDNYTCAVCNRKFSTKESLDMHIKAHSKGKKFICSYCKKPFNSQEALQDHVANQCQQRQYECQYCGRRFSRPHEKVKHERIHTGEKPHVCQICGKAFRVSYCLTLHLRTHSGTRPYQCPHCGKRFKSHSVFNHHQLTHSEVRAYQCPYCPKAFKTSVQLAGHKNSHTKPFACTECNRPFASLYAVRAHMESHKGANNLKFDCWLCGATYARAFALRDHVKSQHAGENDKMDQMLIELETVESANQLENEMATQDEDRMEAEGE